MIEGSKADPLATNRREPLWRVSKPLSPMRSRSDRGSRSTRKTGGSDGPDQRWSGCRPRRRGDDERSCWPGAVTRAGRAWRRGGNSAFMATRVLRGCGPSDPGLSVGTGWGTSGGSSHIAGRCIRAGLPVRRGSPTTHDFTRSSALAPSRHRAMCVPCTEGLSSTPPTFARPCQRRIRRRGAR